MTVRELITAYNAETNMDALMAQRCLENEGIEAFVTEDHSLVGYWMFGTLPGILRPQVWVHSCDAERAGEVLAGYDSRRVERDAKRKADGPRTIEVHCEDCGQPSVFAGSLNGTVQECPHCGSFVNVGVSQWPPDDGFGDMQDDGDAEE